MPGKMDWAAGSQEVNFAMWPVFKALHADNLLTIAEVSSHLFHPPGEALADLVIVRCRSPSLRSVESSSSRATQSCS